MTINRSRFMRLAAVVCMFCLVLTCAVCGTVAKYTSTASGQDVVSVAKWQFEVNSTNIAQATSQTFSFDLFNTINEADTVSTEDGVHTALIAPGTGGSFDIDITNNSEVNAEYTLNMTETNAKGVYIQYSLDNTSWYDDFADINADRTDVAIAKDGGSETVTIYWRWCFEGTDTGAHSGQTDVTDTALGIAGQSAAPTVTISATLTATQVD